MALQSIFEEAIVVPITQYVKSMMVVFFKLQNLGFKCLQNSKYFY